jgi:L-cysteine:1D-myo-inositol 2-amino-2-deoxy-alpha-D-glucopyranoside ligase
VDTVTRLRDHLGNDLDTPRALAAIDAWADEALSHGGSDAHGPSQIRTAVDALLGVEL